MYVIVRSRLFLLVNVMRCNAIRCDSKSRAISAVRAARASQCARPTRLGVRATCVQPTTSAALGPESRNGRPSVRRSIRPPDPCPPACLPPSANWIKVIESAIVAAAAAAVAASPYICNGQTYGQRGSTARPASLTRSLSRSRSLVARRPVRRASASVVGVVGTERARRVWATD